MSYPSLAVIGTAGRKEDKTYLTKDHYNKLVRSTISLITKLKIDPRELKLFSGGAAWADHVVVSLALMEFTLAKNTTLFLPTDLNDQGFFGTDEWSSKTASTANYYHRIFSNVIVEPTLQQLLHLKEMGGDLKPGTGNFFKRNSDVAKSVSPDGVLIAYTFGDPESPQPEWTLKSFSGDTKAKDAGLKDGGTADTWNKATCAKWHGRIGKER